MNNAIAMLYAKMSEGLRHVAVEQENPLQHAERSYLVVEKLLKELRDFIISSSFEKAEEIQFFKEEKPKFLKEYIYYSELFYIESNRPVGGPEMQRKYIEHNLEYVDVFFQRNTFLYTYYRTEKTHLDHIFFLRNADELPLSPANSADIDPRFSTVYSNRLSKLLAFEQLNDYLQQMLRSLNGEKKSLEKPTPLKTINWTASKAELIELAYALQSRGAFNFGKTDVKQVVSVLEACFNIKVGNFYRVFQGQRIRKKSRTIFLDSLKENLIRRMDESDLNPKTL